MSSHKDVNISVKTPLIYSAKLSEEAQCDIYLKLENCQPTGAFKLRGNGFHCQKEVERGCKHLITASGGNTGLAVAYSGQKLNIPVTVYVHSLVPQLIIDKLKKYQNVSVEVVGDNFGIANDRALKEAEKPGFSYIHPYIHPETW